MRKSIFLLALTCMGIFYSHATIRTVNNNPGITAAEPMLYTSFQRAYAAAQAGDTIYLVGSGTAYIYYANGVTPFSTWNKQVWIIGPGYEPANSGQTAKLTFDNGAVDRNDIGALGTSFEGVVFTGTGPDVSQNNISFIRCGFNTTLGSAANATGILITGCFFNTSGNCINVSTTYSYANWTISNNVFFNSSSSANHIANFSNTANSNIVFAHNIFYGGATTAPATIASSRNLTFQNNIFFRRPVISSVSNCIWSNNITSTDLTSGNLPWTLLGHTDLNSSNRNADPMLSGQAQIIAGTTNPLPDFMPNAGSPAFTTIPAGGPNIGLRYVANDEMNNWLLTRFSRLPFVTGVVITPGVAAQGGTINVTVTATNNN